MDKSKSLTPDILKITKEKGTEYQFSGVLNSNEKQGTYLCRQCGRALFRSHSKFHSSCGWPSFDEEIQNTIEKIPDNDGNRTEILCSRCHSHLGHVFLGEGFTNKNLRHCVNSLSLEFVENSQIIDTEEGIFAAGCFWGVEYYFKKLNGVLKTEVGYIGGHKNYPSYEDICSKKSGHLEAIRVIFNNTILKYEDVIKYFFEIHNPTQTNGQGPDIGEQYLSAIFVYDEIQKDISKNCIQILKNKKMNIATKILEMNTFWPAENYHQNYYEKNKHSPYCHVYRKLF